MLRLARFVVAWPHRSLICRPCRPSPWPLQPLHPKGPRLDIVTLSLFLLLAVVLSGIVSRMLPAALPRPLVQIALRFLSVPYAPGEPHVEGKIPSAAPLRAQG